MPVTRRSRRLQSGGNGLMGAFDQEATNQTPAVAAAAAKPSKNRRKSTDGVKGAAISSSKKPKAAPKQASDSVVSGDDGTKKNKSKKNLATPQKKKAPPSSVIVSKQLSFDSSPDGSVLSELSVTPKSKSFCARKSFHENDSIPKPLFPDDLSTDGDDEKELGARRNNNKIQKNCSNSNDVISVNEGDDEGSGDNESYSDDDSTKEREFDSAAESQDEDSGVVQDEDDNDFINDDSEDESVEDSEEESVQESESSEYEIESEEEDDEVLEYDSEEEREKKREEEREKKRTAARNKKAAKKKAIVVNDDSDDEEPVENAKDMSDEVDAVNIESLAQTNLDETGEAVEHEAEHEEHSIDDSDEDANQCAFDDETDKPRTSESAAPLKNRDDDHESADDRDADAVNLDTSFDSEPRVNSEADTSVEQDVVECLSQHEEHDDPSECSTEEVEVIAEILADTHIDDDDDVIAVAAIVDEEQRDDHDSVSENDESSRDSLDDEGRESSEVHEREHDSDDDEDDGEDTVEFQAANESVVEDTSPKEYQNMVESEDESYASDEESEGEDLEVDEERSEATEVASDGGSEDEEFDFQDDEDSCSAPTAPATHTLSPSAQKVFSLAEKKADASNDMVLRRSEYSPAVNEAASVEDDAGGDEPFEGPPGDAFLPNSDLKSNVEESTTVLSNDAVAPLDLSQSETEHEDHVTGTSESAVPPLDLTIVVTKEPPVTRYEDNEEINSPLEDSEDETAANAHNEPTSRSRSDVHEDDSDSINNLPTPHEEDEAASVEKEAMLPRTDEKKLDSAFEAMSLTPEVVEAASRDEIALREDPADEASRDDAGCQHVVEEEDIFSPNPVDRQDSPRVEQTEFAMPESPIRSSSADCDMDGYPAEDEEEDDDDDDGASTVAGSFVNESFVMGNTQAPTPSIVGDFGREEKEVAISFVDESFVMGNTQAPTPSIVGDFGREEEEEAPSIVDESFIMGNTQAPTPSIVGDFGREEEEEATMEEATSCLNEAKVSTPSVAEESLEATIQGPSKTVDLDTDENEELSTTLEQTANVSKKIRFSLSATEAAANEKENQPNKKLSNRRPRKLRREGSVRKGKWSIGHKIGTGSFGVVHVGMNMSTGQLMAIKSVALSPAAMKDVKSEVGVLKSLQHVNIVRYLGAERESDGETLHIFQEWVPGGSVTTLLNKFGPFSAAVMRSYLSQILTGLAYLHDNNILHRDIKGGNVLINDDGIVKLADFGAAKRIAHQQEDMMHSLTMRGTPFFMAPEVFEEHYNGKADIWSVGCVAFQMATATPPWKKEGFSNPMSLFLHLQESEGIPELEWPENGPTHSASIEPFVAMLERCFWRSPIKRPTAHGLLADSFFSMDSTSEDEYSKSHALFSPGGDTVSTFTPAAMKTPHSKARGTPPRMLTPKTPMMSPPLPKKINAVSVLQVSPLQQSPAVDSKNWPSWARDQMGREVQSPLRTRGSPKPSPMLDSLAFTADTSATQNPFARRASSARSKGSLSTLDGLRFIDGVLQ